MIILGINSSHNATAALLVDGKIIACISEERLTRVKNQAGLPILAIKEILKITNLKIADIDYLALNFKDPKVHLSYSTFAGEKGKIVDFKKDNWKSVLMSILWRLKEYALENLPRSRYVIDHLLDIYYKNFVNSKMESQVLKDIEQKLKIGKEKILWSDHHTAHIYSAIFSCPKISDPLLVFTLDSMGDGNCATVSIYKDGKLKIISKTPNGNSIGDLYTQTTAYLGMKLGEHEYKVMGLAPYADPKYFKSLYEKLKKLVSIKSDLTFKTSIHSYMFYRILPKIFAYQRFDNISGALQKLTEDTLTEWVRLAIKKTGIKDIACGGGVFMNVKANQKILELPEVKSFSVMPSSGDESTAIGAALWGYLEKEKKPITINLQDLYLGGEFSDQEIEKILSSDKNIDYKLVKPKNIEKEVARLLSKGLVVARFKGKMEWGARALGNRSILAHPGNLDAIREINSQIKSRDFWMPFAPSILDTDEHKYLINNKKHFAPYMMVTFDTTTLGKQTLKAAIHQYDFTLRPQIVKKEWNSDYFNLIQEFKELTDLGAVLNTSFNLHGYPIVYTPKDALYIFKNSGLKYLAIGSFLLSYE